jgi:hypothetical protein
MDDSKPGPRRTPSIGSMIVWVLFCFAMWAWAIMGPLWLIFWTLAYFQVPGFESFAIPGDTASEKRQQLVTPAILGAVGISFVWLRCRGHLKFGDRD